MAQLKTFAHYCIRTKTDLLSLLQKQEINAAMKQICEHTWKTHLRQNQSSHNSNLKISFWCDHLSSPSQPDSVGRLCLSSPQKLFSRFHQSWVLAALCSAVCGDEPSQLYSYSEFKHQAQVSVVVFHSAVQTHHTFLDCLKSEHWQRFTHLFSVMLVFRGSSTLTCDSSTGNTPDSGHSDEPVFLHITLKLSEGLAAFNFNTFAKMLWQA